ncbi:MAG: hypothetical protein G3M70_16505 [Candidatus Nitronauta litoralis]|uniref:NIF system FeS cluster assembly NifU N-terminal domain-containing protein n=1 Tax=Candidatus Nitronauta litoralis TaxID=2705533 RepID=A0A7T0G1H4_9BACT|nr:MAG: hypothetical protein G3M70_16505 [Candidatus Nitronauta litoralis]
MPCHDTSALISVKFDNSEHLLEYDFSKLTCQKTIGSDNGFLDFSKGREMTALVELEFQDIVNYLKVESSEEQFLLYLEWDALRSTILHYMGKSEELDTTRYQLESIDYQEEGVEIRQVIRPPREMPKIVSCAVSARSAQVTEAPQEE